MMKTSSRRPKADDVDGQAEKLLSPERFLAAKSGAMVVLFLVAVIMASGCTSGGITGRIAEAPSTGFEEGIIGNVSISYPPLPGNWTIPGWTAYSCGMCTKGSAWHPLFRTNITCSDGGSSCNCYFGIEYSVEILNTGKAGNRIDNCEITFNGARLDYLCDRNGCGPMKIDKGVLAGIAYGARIDEDNTLTACCLNSCRTSTIKSPCHQ
jgi:hypothetical protein